MKEKNIEKINKEITMKEIKAMIAIVSVQVEIIIIETINIEILIMTTKGIIIMKMIDIMRMAITIIMIDIIIAIIGEVIEEKIFGMEENIIK